MDDQRRRLTSQASPREPEAAAYEVFRVRPAVFRDHLYNALRQCGYDRPEVDDATRSVTANRETSLPPPLSGKRKVVLTLKWEPAAGVPGATAAAWFVADHSQGSVRRSDAKSIKQIGEVLQTALPPPEPPGPPDDLPLDPVLAPGQWFEGAYTGTLRDYSGCATPNEVLDLTGGVLSLGSYAFGKPGDCYYGPPLSLGLDRTQAPLEYKGVLVCASQNSGKTSLIVRWAEEANQAGYNVFLIDVKGNLRGKLDGRLGGRRLLLLHRPAGGVRQHQLPRWPRLLDSRGHRAHPEPCRRPAAERGVGRQGGEAEFHYRNRAVWLTALIHLLKLRESSTAGRSSSTRTARRGRRTSTTCTSWRSTSGGFTATSPSLREDEALLSQVDPSLLPVCGVDHWVREAAHLIDPRKMLPRFCLPADALPVLREEGVPEEVVFGLHRIAGRVWGGGQNRSISASWSRRSRPSGSSRTCRGC